MEIVGTEEFLVSVENRNLGHLSHYTSSKVSTVKINVYFVHSRVGNTTVDGLQEMLCDFFKSTRTNSETLFQSREHDYKSRSSTSNSGAELHTQIMEECFKLWRSVSNSGATLQILEH